MELTDKLRATAELEKRVIIILIIEVKDINNSISKSCSSYSGLDVESNWCTLNKTFWTSLIVLFLIDWT